jgi:uncharacterized YigZ family protein
MLSIFLKQKAHSLMETKDTYKTIGVPSEAVLFKDKNSKFWGYAFPIKHEDDVKQLIQTLKKEHHTARHWCYAYQLGTNTVRFRANDDGEPNNSAGAPIYGQIQSFNVTNVLIVVVRYFGGVKLGVGGLINAYRTASQLALEQSKIIERTIDSCFLVKFEYKNMNKVMRIIKEKQLNIINQNLELSCSIKFSVRKGNASSVFEIFDALHQVTIKEL